MYIEINDNEATKDNTFNIPNQLIARIDIIKQFYHKYFTIEKFHTTMKLTYTSPKMTFTQKG